MQARYGFDCAGSFQELRYGERLTIDDVAITLFPAGHILGSAQVLLEHKGCRIVVTGDYKRGQDRTCKPFELIPCDILVTEATFGLPVFQHPAPESEINRLLASVAANPNSAHLIGAYSLGKTQRVIKLLREAGYDDTIYLHGANIKLCTLYQELGVDLGDLRAASAFNKDDFAGKIVMAPPSALKDRWSRRFPNPIPAMASGWMAVKQRARQSLVELPLVISDHCDWNELLQTVKESGASKIWVTHGREDALVYACQTMGLEAEPLSIQGFEDDGEDE